MVREYLLGTGILKLTADTTFERDRADVEFQAMPSWPLAGNPPRLLELTTTDMTNKSQLWS